MNTFDGGAAVEPLADGLYESLYTQALASKLAAQPELTSVIEGVTDDASTEILARHIGELARDALIAAKPEDRVAVANGLLRALRQPDSIRPGPQQLLSLVRPATFGPPAPRRPTTRLSDAALLTNGKEDPNLAGEIRAEMSSANRVDLLCAFIRWTGLRLLEPALEDLRERGVRIRVITTTYMGATERRAIDELVNRYGAEVKINYETQA
ncbi:MAG TPA: DUF3427 domain-containing protein, partial [Micrococcaceae bacterium]